MKIKVEVKMFYNRFKIDIEQDINDFLEESKIRVGDLIDIKHSMVFTDKELDDGSQVLFSAMVIYKTCL